MSSGTGEIVVDLGEEDVTSQELFNGINQVPCIQKCESTKIFFAFSSHMHFYLCKCVCNLCEVNLDPQPQAMVQRQTEQKIRKNKKNIKINKMACI